jgi:3',5'-cyclic AMP phosphodiesterase CpdA
VKPVTVAHISDTHLGAAHRDFEANFRALAQELGRVAPDLVVNTGDVTVHGDDDAAEHAHARELHRVLPAAWRVLPGNHDLGDNPPSPCAPMAKPVTRERLDRWRATWGDDWWAQDAEDFRLLGLNAQLLGTGLPDEEAQWAWLADETRAARDRPVALFLHKPLFLADPEDEPATHRYVPAAPRHRLLALLAPTRLRLVASGHVHQHRLHRVGPVLHAWGPSSAYVLPHGFQPVLGTKQVGYNLYHLEGDTVTAQVCTPAALANHDLIDFPGPYGSVRDIMAGRIRYVP